MEAIIASHREVYTAMQKAKQSQFTTFFTKYCLPICQEIYIILSPCHLPARDNDIIPVHTDTNAFVIINQ
jgi:hypothetical protein